MTLPDRPLSLVPTRWSRLGFWIAAIGFVTAVGCGSDDSGGGRDAGPQRIGPEGGTVSAGDGSATVTWTAPGDNGGSAVSGYRIQSSTDGTTWTTPVADTGTTPPERALL